MLLKSFVATLADPAPGAMPCRTDSGIFAEGPSNVRVVRYATHAALAPIGPCDQSKRKRAGR